MMVRLNELARQRVAATILQFEPEFLEETRIQELEVEIGEAERNGDAADSLRRQREQIIQAWIDRVTKEIEEAGADGGRLRRLKDQLRRANEYKNLRFEQ